MQQQKWLYAYQHMNKWTFGLSLKEDRKVIGIVAEQWTYPESQPGRQTRFLVQRPAR